MLQLPISEKLVYYALQNTEVAYKLHDFLKMSLNKDNYVQNYKTRAQKYEIQNFKNTNNKTA